MKVIINGRFLTHKITGVERYATELCLELDKLINKNEIIIALPPEVKNVPDYNNIKVVHVGKLHNRLWEHISFPLYVLRNKGISLNLCNVGPLLNPGLVCIHDVKIKARPHDFSKKFLAWYNLLFSNATKRSKKIITVSEFSKKEICKYYNIDSDKISVIPNAWQHYERIDYDEETLDKYSLKKYNFYFSISSLEPNKNFKWLAKVAEKNPDQTFAIAGSINKNVFSNAFEFQCPKNMMFLGYVSDSEAKTLMRDCKGFLFPTFYEGFGIPPLEAISAGSRYIYVSDSEVMHEVFKNDVNYIDPYTPNLPIDSHVTTNSVLNRYSWTDSANKLYELINEVL